MFPRYIWRDELLAIRFEKFSTCNYFTDIALEANSLWILSLPCMNNSFTLNLLQTHHFGKSFKIKHIKFTITIIQQLIREKCPNNHEIRATFAPPIFADVLRKVLGNKLLLRKLSSLN